MRLDNPHNDILIFLRMRDSDTVFLESSKKGLIMYKIRLVFFVLLSNMVSSVCAQSNESNDRYSIFYYNVKATSDSKMTDQQCQQLLASPVTYNIKNDRHIYSINPNAQFQIKEYLRTSKTFLSDTADLYTGSSKLGIKHQGQTIPATAKSSFVHNKSTSSITGHVDIQGFCCSDFIGVDGFAGQVDTK